VGGETLLSKINMLILAKPWFTIDIEK
jgi:hypothetical protein